MPTSSNNPSNKYPRREGMNVGVQCECVLWLAHYTDSSEAADKVEAWSVEKLYTRPLLTAGGTTNGVLDKLVDRRVGHAFGAFNTMNNRVITKENRDKVKRAIANFESSGASASEKKKSLTDLMLEGIAYQPGMTPAPNEHLLILLKEMHDAGIYLPPNHVGTSNECRKTIQDLLKNGELWDLDFPDGTRTTRFGDMTFDKIFETSLRRLYTYYRPTFDALKDAKECGILRPHKDRPLTVNPDGSARGDGGPTAKTTPNNRCCVNFTCQSNYIGKYCGETSEGVCNAMSDSC